MPDKLTDNLSNNSPILANELSDSEIEMALECFKSKTEKYCEHCDTKFCDICILDKIKLSPDLIRRLQADKEYYKKNRDKYQDNVMFLSKQCDELQAEKDGLFYKLTGVMHSVDKWLDGDELKQDEVNRAATMREKNIADC